MKIWKERMDLERKSSREKKAAHPISTLVLPVIASHCKLSLPGLSIFFLGPEIILSQFLRCHLLPSFREGLPMPLKVTERQVLLKPQELKIWEGGESDQSSPASSHRAFQVGNQESKHAKGQNRRSSLGKQSMLPTWPLSDLPREKAKVVSTSSQWKQHRWQLAQELPGFLKEQRNDTAVFLDRVKWWSYCRGSFILSLFSITCHISLTGKYQLDLWRFVMNPIILLLLNGMSIYNL